MNLNPSPLVATLLCAVSLVSHCFAQDLRHLASFGDSLSDVGNKNTMSQVINQATSGAVKISAGPPNFIGRASNGKVWTEYLSEFLSLPPSIPARAEQRTVAVAKVQSTQRRFTIGIPAQSGNNWSVGGAKAESHYFFNLVLSDEVESISGAHVFPNSAQQIDNRLSTHGMFNADTLVTYMIGTNNLWYTVYGDLGQTGQEAAELALKDIRTLLDHRVAHLVVANIPNFTSAPWLSENKLATSRFINEFNLTLKHRLKALAYAYPQTNIYWADAFLLFNQVIDSVEKKGWYKDKVTGITITNTQEPAYNQNTGKVSTTADQYLYWDGLHPTTGMHKLFARYVADKVNRHESL
ncbi:SGNH/GDSL hydrolase family protein [Vibrio ostreicida]|uniref:SGNH/GDSL hydrolase family protein n=1 Tax=Vibrio ostreicida TaxID=526588 RepID=A0ABT8C050_9VIBR|nr:SGNH/GDSL hydrolase family protein [Vibrio ostreicida]MDN3612339.1 SGNH/GDSL hydrolase family protein [Vibrio ostreicida]NPD08718.1 SGNH/GDSL hydrolase family protein [Vibrio ostreicida]